jgi:hypothetical protein
MMLDTSWVERIDKFDVKYIWILWFKIPIMTTMLDESENKKTTARFHQEVRSEDTQDGMHDNDVGTYWRQL